MATRHEPALRPCRLAAAPVGDVLALIGEERRAWRERLLWDPTELSDALEMAAAARLLTGAAVLHGRRVAAYLSAHAAGDVFRPCSLRIRDDAPPEAVALLVDATLELPELRGRRLEGQLSAFGWQERLDEAFASRGLRVTSREWLVAELDGAAPGPEAAAHGGVQPWDSGALDACGAVLSAAHAHGVESRINAAFAAPEAASGYLREVVRGPGCGHFLPWASSLATANGRVVGFCLVTTIAPGVAHVPQVAVLPGHQGRGLGDALLERARRAAREEGCRRLTLSVSRENDRARSWYLSRGFRFLAPLSAYWS